MAFAEVLLSWYGENKRDLPWRNTSDPYKIWLSEVILQQTRVGQGLPYYYKFTEAFPDVFSLAEAAEEEVLRLWQGLGYYARARNMHAAARQMVADFGGFPDSYKKLLTLKGTGDYTASAVSSIAFNEPHAVVDGNVYRLLSRYFAIPLDISSAAGKSYFKELASSLLDISSPGEFNQAVMEFGATVCKPAPLCNQCPLSTSCAARIEESVLQYPVKSKKAAIKKRYFYYIILTGRGRLYIKKRMEKDIWQGLYDFPLIESKTPVNEKDLFASKEWKAKVNGKHEIVHFSRQIRHQLTHQILEARFIHVKLNEKHAVQPGLKMIPFGDVSQYGMPQLISKYLKETKHLINS